MIKKNLGNLNCILMSGSNQVQKLKDDTYIEISDTFPCWLLVTLNVCVMDPLPLAGRVLPLAGSKCS